MREDLTHIRRSILATAAASLIPATADTLSMVIGGQR
jgi:hypothetical protein